MKAIGYGRVSTSKQAAIGTSLDEQENICRQMAQADGNTEFLWLVDSGLSGKDSANRPEYQKLIELIKHGNCKVYAYSMSRLGRNLRNLMDLWDICDKYDVSLRTYSDQVDTSGPMGKFIRITLAAVWQLQREMIGEDTRDKLQSRKERGIVYSPPRFGFRVEGRVIGSDGKVVIPGIEVIDESEMMIVKRIKQNREIGRRFVEIANMLNSELKFTKSGKPWTAGTIAHVFKQHSNG